MKSLVVDTNVFVRLFLGDIPEQVEIGKELLRKAKRQEIELIVPQAVIFEINFILDKVYKFSKEEIIDKLEAVVGANYLQVQDRESLQEGLRLFRENNLSFVDTNSINPMEIFPTFKAGEITITEENLPPKFEPFGNS